MATKHYMTKLFWISVGERVVFTFLETFGGATLITGVYAASGHQLITGIDYALSANIAAAAALAALIKSIVTGGVTDGSPSATNSETVKPS